MKKIALGALALCVTLSITACSSATVDSAVNSASSEVNSITSNSEASGTATENTGSDLNTLTNIDWVGTQASFEQRPDWLQTDSNKDELVGLYLADLDFITKGKYAPIGASGDILCTDSNWVLKTDKVSDSIYYQMYDTGDIPLYACISYSREDTEDVYPNITDFDTFVSFLQTEDFLSEGTITGFYNIQPRENIAIFTSEAFSVTPQSFYTAAIGVANGVADTHGSELNCIMLQLEKDSVKKPYYLYYWRESSYQANINLFSLIPVDDTSGREKALNRVLTVGKGCSRLPSVYRIKNSGYYFLFDLDGYFYNGFLGVNYTPDDLTTFAETFGKQKGGYDFYVMNMSNEGLEQGNKTVYEKYIKDTISSVPRDSNRDLNYKSSSVAEIEQFKVADLSAERVKFVIKYADGRNQIGYLLNIPELNQVVLTSCLLADYYERYNSVSDAYDEMTKMQQTLRFDENLKREA